MKLVVCRCRWPVEFGLAALLCLASPAGAQEPAAANAPFTKAGLIRQLVFGTMSDTELASEVRRRCLSFEPTATDIADLRQIGATDAVVAAAQSCTRAESAPRAAAPSPEAPPRDAQPPPPAPPAANARAVAAMLEPERLIVIASAGTRSVRALIADEDGGAAADVELSLAFHSDSSAEGSSLREATNERGEAIFQVPVSRLQTGEDLVLSAEERVLARLPVRVVPLADVSIEFIAGLDQRARSGEWLPVPLVLEVRDQDGVPLPAQPVLFSVEGGEADPTGAVTDAQGRARVAVRPVAGSETTRLRAMVGPLSEEAELVRDEAATAATARTQGADAAAATGTGVGAETGGVAVSGGDAVSASDASPASAGAVRGYMQLNDGDLEAAERYFEEALAADPADALALRGLGLVELSRDRPAEAEAHLAQAVRIAPKDAQAWADLGRARTVLRDPAAAEQALYVSRSLDRDDEETRAAIKRLMGLRPWARFGGLGGATVQADSSSSAIAVGLELYPVPALRLWGLYQDGLELVEPMLVRGGDAFQSIWGGVSADWGPEGRLRTSGGFGRRDAGEGFVQNVYHLAQSVDVPRAGRPVRIEFGGYLGRWFDRDDWIGYAELGVPLGVRFTLRPSFRFGETIGTNVAEVGRRPQSDVRGYIGLDYLGRGGWRVEPMVGFGSVSGDAGAAAADQRDLGGSVIDATLLLAVPLGRVASFDVFVRHQRPPVAAAFTDVSAGLTFGVPRDIR